MTTAKNKLPSFGTTATIDESIVDNTSTLKDTGFRPNTVINSAEINTYIKMLVNGMNGIIDSVYNEGVSQGEIDALSSSDSIKNYIVAGLNQIIKTTTVDRSTYADEATNANEATNVRNIVNNDTADNANVRFTIGDKTFSKTVNNVVNAASCSGNASSSTRLQNARTFNISGDATGTAQSFDGTENITIPIDVKKSAALDSVNVGDSSHPVYFNAEGKPVRIDKVEEASHADIADNATNATNATNSTTANEAIKLQNARNINLTGDASGSTSFDGTGNVSIATRVEKSRQIVNDDGDPENAGTINTPVYFNNGIPVRVNMFVNLGDFTLTKDSTDIYTTSRLSDTSNFLAFVEVGADNGVTYLSGLIQFNRGLPITTLSGSHIANKTTSSSSTIAFVNTVLFGSIGLDAICVEGQAVYGDGHTDSNITYTHIKIHKVYQIS